MQIINKIFLLIVCFFSVLTLHGQEDWGGKVGLSIQLGSHIDRIGLMYQFYYFNNNIQLSQGSDVRFNLKNLGPKGSYAEFKIQIGLQGQWLEGQNIKYLYNEFSNLSPYRNSAGYSFYVYLDNKGMSQTTGAIHANFDDFLFAIDNDALGLNQVDDKYRTGGFYVGYQVDSALYGIQSTLWTGKSSEGPRIDDEEYPSRFGYRDASGANYGMNSHGILSLRYDQILIHDQVARAELGIDAERIRHLIQNKLIHDGISGRFVKSESPHYPMMAKDGSLFLFKENQKVKPAKLYFQLSANQFSFY